MVVFFNLFKTVVNLQCCVSFRCTASDSVVYIHIHKCIFLRFFSIMGYSKLLNILNTVPCATQEILVAYLFYIQYCVSVNPKLLIYPIPFRLVI